MGSRHRTALCCTVLRCFCTVLYAPLLCYTVLYCTELYCTVLYCIVLYYSVLHCAALLYAVLWCAVRNGTALPSSILYYTELYCTVTYCTSLLYTVLGQNCTALCCLILLCTVRYRTLLHYIVRCSRSGLNDVPICAVHDDGFFPDARYKLQFPPDNFSQTKFKVQLGVYER